MYCHVDKANDKVKRCDTLNEKQAFDKLINCLTDHNLVQSKDYYFRDTNHGCFNVVFCPKRCVYLDVAYFYEMIPDIRVFKIKYCDNKLGSRTMNLTIKIHLR